MVKLHNLFLFLALVVLNNSGAAPADSVVSPAPQLVTVDQLVVMALENHPEMLAMKARIDGASAGRDAAGRWPNPELSGELGHKRDDASGDNGFEFSVALMQPLEYPGKAATRQALADNQVLMAEAERDVFRRMLAGRVRGLAGAWSVKTEWVTQVEGAVAGLDQALQGFLQRLPAGNPQLLDQKLIASAMVEMQREMLDIRRETDALGARLRAEVGWPLTEKLSIAPVPLAEIVTNDTQDFVSENPALRNHLMAQEQARLEMEATRLAYRPDIAAGPYYALESVEAAEHTIGVAIALPLPVWNRGQGDVRQAAARRLEADAAYQQAIRELTTELDRIEHAMHHHRRVLDHYTEAHVADLRNTAELALSQFLAGAVSTSLCVDLYHAYLAAMRVRYETLAALHEEVAALQTIIHTGELP